MNDWELLQSWVQQRSDAAFTELVSRHLDLVYASALRQVREPELARDVSQAVFLALAQKAPRLSSKVILSGWLFRTTGFVAARALRSEARRKRWETEASTMTPLTTDSATPEQNWTVVQSQLDSALQSLPARDRDALLLRFFEKQPLRSVGDRFGITEDAAKKRVNRAVEKLRSILTKRGIAFTSAALGTLLLNIPAQAAPHGFAAAISHIAATGAASTSVAVLTAAALRDLFISKLRQLAPFTAAALLLLSTTLWLASKNKVTTSPSTPQSVPLLSPETKPQAAPVADGFSAATPKPGPSRILLSVQSAIDNSPLVATLRASGSARLTSTIPIDLTTDAAGLAEIPVDGSRVSSFRVWLSAPGYVPVSLSWRGHEFVEPVLYYTAKLQPGYKLEGIVQNEQGLPVPDARITFNGPGISLGERQNIGFANRLTAIKSDDKGRFHSDQLPAPIGDHAMSYAIEHDDYVRETVQLSSLEALQTNHVVILKSGLKIHGTVVDASGRPVAGAKVTEDHNFAGPHRNTEADANGFFEIGPFSSNENISLAASANGFQENKMDVNVSPAATNVVLQLSIASGEKNEWERGMDSGVTIRLIGTVVDEASGQPLPLFRVRLQEHRGTDLSLVGEGHNGHFDWPVFMAFFQEFSLEVEADGYEPFSTDIRPVQKGAQKYEVKLRQSLNLAGTVLGPDGHPVANAFVGLNGQDFSCSLIEGSRPSPGSLIPQTLTDSNGRFSFKPKLGVKSVLAVHDLGAAQVSIATLAKQPIVLQPWGAIDGRLIVHGKALAGQGIGLTCAVRQGDQSIACINAQAITTTDAQGRFHFPKVPAGPLVVCRFFNFNRNRVGPIGMSHSKEVLVPSGGTVEVTIGGSGATLVGKLALSQDLPGHDWRDDLQSLNQSEPNAPVLTPTSDFAALQRFARESEARNARATKYYLEIESDGSFHIDDVPPGNYVLDLKVAQPIASSPASASGPEGSFDRRDLGKYSKPVQVPENEEDTPIELGTITIPLDPAALARLNASFE